VVWAILLHKLPQSLRNQTPKILYRAYVAVVFFPPYNDCLHRTCWLKKSRPFLLEKGSFQLSPNILRYIALTDHLLRTQANLKIHHAILDASSSASSQVLKKHETVRLELQSQVICFILQSFVRKRDEQLYDDNITTRAKL